MTYTMKVAGLERELPLCKVSDDLYIGAFIMFGDAAYFSGRTRFSPPLAFCSVPPSPPIFMGGMV